MRKLHTRILAFLLLLVFSQKLGLRLWIHDIFHEARINHSAGFPDSDKIQFKCDCIEDAMMPQMESAIIAVPDPLEKCIDLSETFDLQFSSTQKLYCSLKGPPATSLRVV
jgi:hypothetical protein